MYTLLYLLPSIIFLGVSLFFLSTPKKEPGATLSQPAESPKTYPRVSLNALLIAIAVLAFVWWATSYPPPPVRSTNAPPSSQVCPGFGRQAHSCIAYSGMTPITREGPGVQGEHVCFIPMMPSHKEVRDGWSYVSFDPPTPTRVTYWTLPDEEPCGNPPQDLSGEVCPNVSSDETHSCLIGSNWSSGIRFANGGADNGKHPCFYPAVEFKRWQDGEWTYWSLRSLQGQIQVSYRLFPPPDDACPSSL